MPKEPNKKAVGLFMLIGFTVLTVIVGYFLQSTIFGKNKNLVVMYFEESINGLNVGSPVVFKGVEVGKVARIDLLTNMENLDFSIPVYVRMENQGIRALGKYDTKQELLDALIAKGLRARLTTQSFVTGQLMIELEVLPDTKVVLHPHNSKYVEIPTVLSPIGELSKGLQDLPIKESVEKFNKFFDGLNGELPKISKIVKNIDGMVSRNSGLGRDVLQNFDKAMVSISEAAKSLRNLTDYLERHPESLLRGKGGY